MPVDTIGSIAVFVILFGPFVLGVFAEVRYFYYLRKKHYAVWQKLGGPIGGVSYGGSGDSLETQRKVRAFENSNEYLSLNDEKLNQMIALKKKVLTGVKWFLIIWVIVIIYVELRLL